jgi:hypothetical protein
VTRLLTPSLIGPRGGVARQARNEIAGSQTGRAVTGPFVLAGLTGPRFVGPDPAAVSPGSTCSLRFPSGPRPGASLGTET